MAVVSHLFFFFEKYFRFRYISCELHLALFRNMQSASHLFVKQPGFPVEEIKKLYEWRWGIERSFRERKYTIGLTNFHAKKVEYIQQEIFARLMIDNFCERMVTDIVIRQKGRKYTYQINFTAVVLICRNFSATGYLRQIEKHSFKRMFFL